MFYLNKFLYFLSYIIHKYLIWVFFLLKSSYKVIQKLSKVIQKLSIQFEKNKKNSKKSRKIPKKSDFFTFFLMLSSHFLSKVDRSVIMWIWEKNVKKKRLKKKWFSFLQTFFLKSILDIFLCPISKLKKKFWKVEDFPFFRPWKYCYSSPEKRYFMFFLRNSYFQGNFR